MNVLYHTNPKQMTDKSKTMLSVAIKSQSYQKTVLCRDPQLYAYLSVKSSIAVCQWLLKENIIIIIIIIIFYTLGKM